MVKNRKSSPTQLHPSAEADAQVKKQTRSRNKAITDDSSSAQSATWDRVSASKEEPVPRRARQVAESTNILSQSRYHSPCS